jgi:hypothetical protein
LCQPKGQYQLAEDNDAGQERKVEVMGLPAVIRLNVSRYKKIAASKGWESSTAAARSIGCEVSTLTRIINGERSCGGEFIANLLVAAAPWEFNDLFEVDTDHDGRSKAA